ncbi:MAG: hypothetical protein UY50_C0003G0022 [Parcubacteria group bacterium GW2011_GWA2_49_9]|nr:MAG: hypothetical protein UY50_C0003G0022 [Parcubacteria group bacterium GW2011_GWA2_49_9]
MTEKYTSDPKLDNPPKGTIEQILEGNSEIRFLSDSLDTRDTFEGKWQGRAYLYEVKMRDGKVWNLTVWFPATIAPDPYKKKPKMQITILTNQGEMPLSANQETLDRVYKAIRKTG